MIEIGRLRTEVALQRTMSGVERERGVEIVREAARQMVGCASMSDRKFRAHFFGTVEMTWDVWETIRFHQRLGAEVGLLDFLRFLYFIKVHGPSLDVIATRLHIDQIDWERRFANWDHLAPSAVVDTKAVPVTRRFVDEPWDLVNRRREGKHPFVLFEFATSFTGEIVHVDGPFKATAQDVTIFRSGLKHLLRDGEQLLGDAGYRHEDGDGIMAAPGGRSASMTPEARKRAGEVHSARQIVERAIGRMDALAIMHCGWRLDKEFLKDCVFAAAKLANAKLIYCPLN